MAQVNYSDLMLDLPRETVPLSQITLHQRRWHEMAWEKRWVHKSLHEKGETLHRYKNRDSRTRSGYSEPRISSDYFTIRRAIKLWEIHYAPKTNAYDYAEVMRIVGFDGDYDPKWQYHSGKKGFHYWQKKLLGLVEKAIHNVMQKYFLANRSQVQREDLMDALLDMVPDRVYSDAEIDFLTTLYDYGTHRQRQFALTSTRDRAQPKILITTSLVGLENHLEKRRSYCCKDRFFLGDFLRMLPILSYQKAYDLLHYGYRLEWIHEADEDLILQKCHAYSIKDFDDSLQTLSYLMKKRNIESVRRQLVRYRLI